MTPPAGRSAGSSQLGSAERRAQLGELENIGSRQVRLVVWLPALMLLSILLVTIWLHLYLDSIFEQLPDSARGSGEEPQRVLFIGSLAAIAAGAIGGLMAWQIVRPLRSLRSSMRQVALGDLSSKVGRASLGELEALNLTFNQMVAQLQGVFEERDRQMREAAQGSVLTIDRSGRLLSTDDSFNRVFGLDGDDLRGLALLEGLRRSIPREANRVFLDSLRKVVEDALGGRGGGCTSHYTSPQDEKPRLLSVRAARVESCEEGGPAAILDARDLSSLEGFYEEMQRADRLAAVGTLATGIAHEIRNPLASIRAMAQLLREDLSTTGNAAGAGEYLGRVEREVDRLERLVRSIMDFANQEESPPVNVDINVVLQEAHEAALARVDLGPREPLEVEWQLDPNLPLIQADEPKLGQALLNLMINALEEIRAQRGGRMRIASRWNNRSRSRPVELRISNTGGPIPADVRERLFEPFFTTKPEGTGLGLPISYQILASQGGILDLQSAGGIVHTIIRLPLAGRQSLAYLDESQTISRDEPTAAT